MDVTPPPVLSPRAATHRHSNSHPHRRSPELKSSLCETPNSVREELTGRRKKGGVSTTARFAPSTRTKTPRERPRKPTASGAPTASSRRRRARQNAPVSRREAACLSGGTLKETRCRTWGDNESNGIVLVEFLAPQWKGTRSSGVCSCLVRRSWCQGTPEGHEGLLLIVHFLEPGAHGCKC